MPTLPGDAASYFFLWSFNVTYRLLVYPSCHARVARTLSPQLIKLKKAPLQATPRCIVKLWLRPQWLVGGSVDRRVAHAKLPRPIEQQHRVTEG
jgi:hypothetical protein